MSEKTYPWTPGKWKACHNGECSCKTIGNDANLSIAKITSGEWGDEYPSLRFVEGTTSIDRKVEAYLERTPYGKVDEAEAIANIRICTAAPAIYIALEGLLEMYVRMILSGDCGNCNPEEEKEVIDSRAALELALKGEP